MDVNGGKRHCDLPVGRPCFRVTDSDELLIFDTKAFDNFDSEPQTTDSDSRSSGCSESGSESMLEPGLRLRRFHIQVRIMSISII